jgi:orotate phosphoribosyltransferase
MSKKPFIERCPIAGGLTGESAYQWAVFLAEEADMDGDIILFDRFTRIAEQLKPQAGVPSPSSVHYKDLEKALEVYAGGKHGIR